MFIHTKENLLKILLKLGIKDIFIRRISAKTFFIQKKKPKPH